LWLLPLIRRIRVIRVSKTRTNFHGNTLSRCDTPPVTDIIPLVRKTILILLSIASSASSQDPSLKPNPSMTPRLRAALDVIKADNAWTIEQQRTICEIPAHRSQANDLVHHRHHRRPAGEQRAD
jgi:hypothetical protein